MPGPDFPTGGEIVESRDVIEQAYATGRGSFRVRAKWNVEKLGVGQYQIVITEMPYQVPKARLIEKIAELLTEKKLALLADIRDESAEDVRLVLEPKSRNVDPKVLMESLFRQTELEARFPLNMNVLDATGVPRVMNLREVLQAFLDHRHEVLVRRSKFRLGNIEHRLEILAGYLIAYLNIDEVIRIIRRDDDPKAAMMKKWKLTEVQADAILNMRLRALRKLEEIEIKQEHDKLSEEKKELNRLLKDEERRWVAIGKEITDIRARFGEKTELGKRRSIMGDAPTAVVVPIEALIERESLTIVVSQKGWVRAFKGHLDDLSDIRYKEGDGARFAIKAESTDKLLIFATNGRFYMVPADKLPRGRGDGENLKLMVDMGNNETEIVEVMLHKPGRKLLVAASDGRGFIVPEDEVLAQTRAGKQILNVGDGIAAQACTVVDGDTVAVQGNNRKLLLFKLEELPEMTRGRGVILQRYKQGGLGAVRTFSIEGGWPIGFKDSDRKENAPKNWLGSRGQAGLLPPKGLRLF
jgi:topoisomerase-4 subunit A